MLPRKYPEFVLAICRATVACPLPSSNAGGSSGPRKNHNTEIVQREFAEQAAADPTVRLQLSTEHRSRYFPAEQTDNRPKSGFPCETKRI